MAGLRPGESFLSAATRDRKAADKRAEEALQREEEKAQARAWASQRSIFVPTQLAAKPPKKKKKTVMPGTEYRGGDKRTPSQQASDNRRAQVRKLNTETRRKERFQLGLKTMAPKATIYDAVPVGRTKHDQEITRALDHPPSTLSPRELHDWKTKMIGFSTLSPGEKRNLQQQADAAYTPSPTRGFDDFVELTKGIGKGIAEGVRPVSSLLIPGLGGLDPRRGGDIKTAGDLKKKYEEAADVVAGKSLSNLAFHGDVPNTLGEAGGLAAGVLTIGPAGKVGRAVGVGGKLAFDAIKAEQGIKAAVEAGKAGAIAGYTGPSVTGKIIEWGRAANGNRMGPRQIENVRANAGMLVKTRQALVEAGDHDAAAQIERILDKADIGPNGEFHGWEQKAYDARVASKTNEKNRAKGIVRGNKKTVLNAQGIHVAGPFTDEQWVEKVLAAFPTKGERDEWAQWYEEFAPAFRDAFGDHAEALMRGFAVSQANNSPTGGLLATLRVLDRLQAGDTAKQISNKGIGTKSLVKTIAKAVEGKDGKVDSGVAAKLSDFIDSFLQKDTRSWMGDHAEGGMPSAIDVHAMRDQGLIDRKLANKLKTVHGLVEGKDFVVDSSGSASGPLYERLSERYEQIARHLNSMNDGAGFDGRNNWKPKEVQALGWGATQKTHGVDPENLGSAFLGNTRQFNLQVGKNLTQEEAARVSAALAPHVEKIIAQTGEGAFPVRGVSIGVHGGAHGANDSLHFQVMSSPEEAQKLTDRLASIFPQYEVTAYKVGGGLNIKPSLRIRNIPDEATAARVWSSLKEQDPKRFGKGYSFVDGEIVVPMAGGRLKTADRDLFADEVGPFVARAADDADLPADHPLSFDGANLQTIKGKSSGEADLRGRGRGGRGQSLERRTDAEARRALDRAVRGIEESRARAAGRRLAVEETGTLSPWEMKQRRRLPAPSPSASGPLANRVPRFASEAVPRTAQDVSRRIVELDSKLDPIISDIARGLKKAGHGAGSRDTLAKTDKPDYFQSYGAYEQAKIDAWDARKAKFAKRNPGKKYPGANYTDQWPEWGEDDRFVWGDPDTYALESSAQVKTDRSMGWYRDQAETQLMKQLAEIASQGGEDGRKARRMLIMFQERESLKRLESRHAGAEFFPEDVPAEGYGADLRARRLALPPSAVQDALRPREVPGPRPTRASIPGPGGGGKPPPVRPVARQLPDPEFDRDYTQKVIDKVLKALPENKRVYAEEAGLRSEERANRLRIAMHEFEKGSDAGPAGMIKARMEARKALAGALPKLDFQGWEFLDQDGANALMAHAFHDPRLQEWEKVRVIWAVDRALRQGRLTPSEVKLFEKTFGPKVAENLGNRENMTILRKLYQLGMDIWNSPRSIMASFDVSAPFRQGLVIGARHPIIFGKNLGPMMRSMMSEKNYLAYMDEIAGRENFPLYEKMKLAIQDVHGSGSLREEAFPPSLAERTPILKHPIAGSSRAYSLFLSKTRADVADHLLDAARPQNAEESRILKALGVHRGKPNDDEDFLAALGNFINTSTGRGKLPGGAAEKAAPFLNTFLFSPRLLASRFQILNPVYYAHLYRQDPFVARQAAQAAVHTLAAISTTLFLASRIPGVDVNLNPTNSDFGQIRVGDTRIDLAGGFRPLLVLYMRIIKNRTTVSSTGENRPLGGFGGKDRWGLLIRFMEGKMAPTPGLIRDLASDQKTFIGEPMTWQQTAQNMLTPLNTQGAIDALKQDGYSMGAIALILGSIGLGTASYPDKEPESKSKGGSAPMPDDAGGGGAPMPDSGGGGGAPMPP